MIAKKKKKPSVTVAVKPADRGPTGAVPVDEKSLIDRIRLLDLAICKCPKCKGSCFKSKLCKECTGREGEIDRLRQEIVQNSSARLGRKKEIV